MYTSGDEVAMGDQYRIDLHGNDTSHDLYRASGPISDSLWEHFDIHLRPGKVYALLVSMYQRGVPFYAQEGKWKTEGSYFSKELPLPFSATKDYDERSFWQKFVNWQGEKF
jgi:hypothetical protein